MSSSQSSIAERPRKTVSRTNCAGRVINACRSALPMRKSGPDLFAQAFSRSVSVPRSAGWSLADHSLWKGKTCWRIAKLGIPCRRRVSSGSIVTPTMETPGARRLILSSTDAIEASSPRLPVPQWASSATRLALGRAAAARPVLSPCRSNHDRSSGVASRGSMSIFSFMRIGPAAARTWPPGSPSPSRRRPRRS